MSPEWQRFDRRAVPVSAIFMTGVAVMAGVPSAIGLSDISVAVALGWVLPGAVLVVVAGTVAEWLRLRYSRYRVGPERVELHTGMLIRNRRSLQRDRIRTVDVTANPLLRVFGLVSVRIGTGEHAEKGTVRLNPVTRATGDELRRTLLDRAAEPVADGTLAVFDPGWIRYAPLSFVAPLLGASAVGGALNVADWVGLSGGLVEWTIDRLGGLGLIGGIAVLAGVALVLGVIGALGLWVEMWWSYRLDREPGGTLRVRRGLLTTRSISVEEQRVRGVDLVEALGTRLAGAARVDVVATGLATGAEQNKAQHSTLLPAAPTELAQRVAAGILREPVSPTEAVQLTPHPVAARGRRLRWALAGVLAGEFPLVLLGVLLTEVLLHIAWISALVAVPVAVALAVDAYRSLGHGIHGDYLVARSGSVRRSTVALQRRGIIGWTVRQSVFQRRAGLATVRATTAAGSGAYSIRDVAAGRGIEVADAAVPGLLTPFLEEPPQQLDL
ncbi:PH domain-containing protein [Actinoplanes sp. LDG1-06]|uniref:PH domain-containing protein n=1 Tax=Paractinoplanes ovalisporus TaxID=2810368 RepID=A0ABS2ALX0_9ACTN|nr:PH domain-containing protein [Actinoplanes ovalisporus]MBM2620763.1 PH domain-containing protein [Actinoplanes ovalisporus]